MSESDQIFTIDTHTALQHGDIPEFTQILVFCNKFNQQLDINIIPSSVKTIIFGNSFNQPILPHTLPLELHTIKFGRKFNQQIEANILPPNLKEIKFGCNYNQPLIPHSIPFGVLQLSFGRHFNQVIANIIPDSIVVLNFYNSSDHYINPQTIPKSTRKLTIQGRLNPAFYRRYIDLFLIHGLEKIVYHFIDISSVILFQPYSDGDITRGNHNYKVSNKWTRNDTPKVVFDISQSVVKSARKN